MSRKLEIDEICNQTAQMIEQDIIRSHNVVQTASTTMTAFNNVKDSKQRQRNQAISLRYRNIQNPGMLLPYLTSNYKELEKFGNSKPRPNNTSLQTKRTIANNVKIEESGFNLEQIVQQNNQLLKDNRGNKKWQSDSSRMSTSTGENPHNALQQHPNIAIPSTSTRKYQAQTNNMRQYLSTQATKQRLIMQQNRGTDVDKQELRKIMSQRELQSQNRDNSTIQAQKPKERKAKSKSKHKKENKSGSYYLQNLIAQEQEEDDALIRDLGSEKKPTHQFLPFKKNTKNRKQKNLDNHIDNLLSAWDENEDSKIFRIQKKKYNKVYHEAYFMNSKEIIQPIESLNSLEDQDNTNNDTNQNNNIHKQRKQSHHNSYDCIQQLLHDASSKDIYSDQQPPVIVDRTNKQQIQIFRGKHRSLAPNCNQNDIIIQDQQNKYVSINPNASTNNIIDQQNDTVNFLPQDEPSYDQDFEEEENDQMNDSIPQYYNNPIIAQKQQELNNSSGFKSAYQPYHQLQQTMGEARNKRNPENLYSIGQNYLKYIKNSNNQQLQQQMMRLTSVYSSTKQVRKSGGSSLYNQLAQINLSSHRREGQINRRSLNTSSHPDNFNHNNSAGNSNQNKKHTNSLNIPVLAQQKYNIQQYQHPHSAIQQQKQTSQNFCNQNSQLVYQNLEQSNDQNMQSGRKPFHSNRGNIMQSITNNNNNSVVTQNTSILTHKLFNKKIYRNGMGKINQTVEESTKSKEQSFINQQQQ
ncbi:UNKNOWN [Stylonychia lemnae]|uniref:Uncharacterized protein n=1 Tax=Stylonychia lemnae TaxID=5949 RepID=A0A078ALM8_STYLE|nr:UNKNOWN [Stylonychia lemnae]|eukprot:CDW83129.1 UNKNOWN [Stylonychia lemnae]